MPRISPAQVNGTSLHAAGLVEWVSFPTPAVEPVGTLPVRGHPSFGAGVQISASGYGRLPYQGKYALVGQRITLSAWCVITATTGDMIVFGKPFAATHTSPYLDYGLWVRASSGEIQFRIGSTVLSAAAASTSNALQHIVGTVAGTSMSIYVNGRSVASTASTPTPTNTNSRPLLFGTNADGGERFGGYLFDCRVYGRGMTASEVWSMYAAETRFGLYAPLTRTVVGLTASAFSPAWAMQSNRLIGGAP